MTRFARAKGSKSSNLKAPDGSTPWEVMKEQLLQAKKESEENKNRQQAENQRVENYSNFLKEQKVLKRKATWCDFPEAEKNKKTKDSASKKNNVVEKKNKTNKTNGNNLLDHRNTMLETSHDNVSEISMKKKKKNKTLDDYSESEVNNESASKKNNVEEKKKKTNKSNGNNLLDHVNSAQETCHENVSEIPMKKKKKKKNKTLNEYPESEVNNEDPKVTTVQYEPIKEEKLKKKKKNNQHEKQDDKTSTKTIEVNNQVNQQMTNNTNGSQKRKIKKKRGDKPTRRKEINDKSFQLIINGKEVALMRFDGFPIMKKDADRLSLLKSSMIKKGIPKSEVNRTIKLERRRAEKALARLKRDVCYNCRKGGHNLSDCPELKSNIPGVAAADGVCFKCGSTEHRQFECKVQRDKEFRFASCFICKEQGHIARQCPDNPKGLYPNGGCCKLCGDVTHLRKDCPTDQNKKEETAIKLPTLDMGSNIEDINLQSKPNFEQAPKNKMPKKIKF